MSNVKIRDIKVIMTQPVSGGRFTVVKIETTEPGLYGLGDASYRTRPLAVRSAIIDYLRPFLIGKDVANTEDIWQSAYVSSYWRNGPVLNNALGGIDEALWDIKGKMANMPVYDLLGGKSRDAAAVYGHASGGSLKETEDSAFELLERGLPGIATPHWYPFLYNGTTGAKILADRIELYFVDGGRGDDDVTANGVIVDPGAPVIDQRLRPWQHPLAAVDVNDDGSVSPLDALQVVNELNLRGTHALSTLLVAPDLPPSYFDVSGDGFVSPVDALQVVNDLNENGARSLSIVPSGEGEGGPVVAGFVPRIRADAVSSSNRAGTDVVRGGQAHFAPKALTSEPVPGGFGESGDFRQVVPSVAMSEEDKSSEDWQELELFLDLLAQDVWAAKAEQGP